MLANGQMYDNVVWEKKLCCCKKRKPWKDQKDRSVRLGEPDLEIGDNSITTTKYSFATFLPLVLYEQFSKLANVYFIVKRSLIRS
jgi:phospholipid-transporting ATPase